MNNQPSTIQPPNQMRTKPARVAIIGTGLVGSTCAYTLLLSGLAGEIVLIDANHARAQGEAMDLNHAMPFSHATRIWAGSAEDCAGADVVIVSAGVAQKPGESRLELVQRNAAIFGQIIPAVIHSGFDGVLLIATNPVDVLTYMSLKLSGLPARRVIGSGTILDTARFRFEISRHFGVDPRSVQADIVGEHGDSSQPVWSGANVGGIKLEALAAAQNVVFNQETKDEIFARARDAAASIIQSKGATYYAIAAGLTCIVEAVLRDQNTVLCVSSLMDNLEDMDELCLSLPSVVNRSGIERILTPDLSAKEMSGLRHSAQVLKASIASIENSAH
ncbi:MAG: L-lactate dehydrogenase [Abditibacteriota bacterium]|nr:L-lactate dehydrogenase [Abditibacteriota bacterium]